MVQSTWQLYPGVSSSARGAYARTSIYRSFLDLSNPVPAGQPEPAVTCKSYASAIKRVGLITYWPPYMTTTAFFRSENTRADMSSDLPSQPLSSTHLGKLDYFFVPCKLVGALPFTFEDGSPHQLRTERTSSQRPTVLRQQAYLYCH